MPKHPKSAAVLLVALASCSKGSAKDSAPAAASNTPAPSASVARPAVSAPPATATEHASWTGTYVAKVGAVEPPKNANEKTWTADPGTTAVGKGAIELVVGERGETRGETHGPLGELAVSGTYDGKELRANLTPKEPKADGAMTGFMTLAAEGDALKGTMRVSNRDAKIVREASVELAKK